jgi:hypothetical protein
MRSRRIITPAIACIAAIWAASPAPAPASPLLSGYGGPGQGSQVILGSSLVNGPPKGGGGGSQGGGGSTGAGESSSAAAAGRLGTAAGSGQAHAGAVVHKHRTTTGTKARGVRVQGSSSGSGAYPASPAHAAVRPAAVGSETLGVSGIDLLYLLLALGALVLTAVLTRRIARTSDPAGSTGG